MAETVTERCISIIFLFPTFFFTYSGPSVSSFFKESALGRFFHRVAMCIYIYISVPFSCNFFAWNKTGPSIGHASIILHAWSPKNGGWVQSVNRPLVKPSRGRVYAFFVRVFCTRFCTRFCTCFCTRTHFWYAVLYTFFCTHLKKNIFFT